MDNLIITSARGYGPELITPFLESIARHCPSTTVAIITLPRDEQNYQKLKARYPFLILHSLASSARNPDGIPLAPTPGIPRLAEKMKISFLLILSRKLGFKSQVAYESQRMLGLSTLDLNWCIRRYFAALQILVGDSHNYKYVMLSDIRDVILQGNPFQAVQTAGLHTGLEGVTVASNYSNSTWIKDAYGLKVYEQLSDQISVCSGVSIGTRTDVIAYLKAFCNESSEVMRAKGTANLPVWDQAFHIKMLLLDNYPHVKVPVNGFISTLGVFENDRVSINDQSEVLVDGVKPLVVHQYDRHPELSEMILKHYS